MVLDLVFCDNKPKIKYTFPEPVTRIFKGLDGAWFSSDGISVFSHNYSGLNLNQDKATKPQTVQIVRQGEVTPYWFKFNPLYNGGRYGY